MDDEIIGDLTKEDLSKYGFSTGNAMKFLKAFASSSAAPKAAVGSDAATVPSFCGGDAYALFVAAYDGSQAPQYPDQLLAAVRETTFAFCRKYRVGEAEAVRYFKEIQAEAVEKKHSRLKRQCNWKVRL